MTADPLCGQTLDSKYVVERRLGAGGMGAVYVARHVGIGRTVAIKVVRPDLMMSAQAQARFDREARAAGSLRHPNIVNVTDYGVTSVEGRPVAYLVMEYLEGQTLSEVLDHSPSLPLRLVVDITSQIAEALSVAHGAGVVHRDLKPANIWLTPDGRGGYRVALLDFGIATLRDDVVSGREAARGEPVEDVLTTGSIDAEPDATFAAIHSLRTGVSLTHAGEIIGTPAFMSPEQCAGGTVDHRSDVYSLGVVVYRMLAGRLPFAGDTLALLRQHKTAVPQDLHQIDNRIDAAPARTVARALAKSPDDRFSSARAFASALEASSLRPSEAFRRAAAIFVQRMPDVLTVTPWIVLPSAIGAALGLLALLILPRSTGNPTALLFVTTGFFFTAPTAMASMAAMFDDLTERPYSRVSWRSVARAIGRTPSGAASLAAAILRPTRTYLRTSRRSRSNSLRNMLMFIGEYRGGAVPDDARIDRMIATLRPGTLGTILALQLFCTFVLPIVIGFAALGVSSFDRIGSPPLIGVLAGVVSVPVAQVLQPLVALVDVIMFDLALRATAD